LDIRLLLHYFEFDPEQVKNGKIPTSPVKLMLKRERSRTGAVACHRIFAADR
jgi:hypothetical protein